MTRAGFILGTRGAYVARPGQGPTRGQAQWRQGFRMCFVRDAHRQARVRRR